MSKAAVLNYSEAAVKLFCRKAVLKIFGNVQGKYSEAVARRCSVKKVFLEISQNSQENTCARVCNFVKKETLAQVFPVNFAKFLRTPFPTEHLRWLLLNIRFRVHLLGKLEADCLKQFFHNRMAPTRMFSSRFSKRFQSC